ncbi:MAG: LPS-assembly protein LptD [bacterium]
MYRSIIIMVLPSILLGSTVIIDPSSGDLKEFVEGGFIEKEFGEKVSLTLEGESIPIVQTRPKVEYKSPFAEPLKSGEVRFWVDPEIGWIEYNVRDDIIYLKTRAEIEYEDIHLASDEVNYQTEDKIIKAEGGASLSDSEGTINGQRMTYSFDTKKGVVYQGESEIEKGFYTGERLKKTGENEYCGQRGNFTTCEYALPHYHFWSPKVKIYPKDKVIAKPVVVFMDRIPILVLPYYILSLKRERHSGFLQPYYRYVPGEYLLINTGYYWAVNNFSDITMMLDYNSKIGWGQRLNLIYLYGTKAGINSTYIAHYRDRETNIEWWKIYSSHRQDITENTTLLTRIDLRNDTSFDKYFSEDFEIRTRRNLSSFATLTTNRGSFSVITEVSRTTSISQEGAGAPDNDLIKRSPSTTFDILPRLSLSGPRLRLFGSAFYVNWNISGVNSYQNDNLTARFIEGGGGLSLPFKIKWLRFESSINGKTQLHYIDKYGKHGRLFALYNLSNSVSTKIYGIFHPSERELRHIITPSLSYLYSPPYDSSWMISGGGKSDGSSSFTLTLDNAFAMMGEKGKSEGQRFLDITNSIGYNMKSKARKFSDLLSSIELSPNFSDIYWFTSRLTMNHDVYDWTLDNISVNTEFNIQSKGRLEKEKEEEEKGGEEKGFEEYKEEDQYREYPYGDRYLGTGRGVREGFSLSLIHTYSKTHGSPYGIQALGGRIELSLTNNWRVAYETNYDVVEKRFQRHIFRIYRDLHCWEAEVRLSYEQGSVIYWFELRIKEIPEIRITGTQQREI